MFLQNTELILYRSLPCRSDCENDVDTQSRYETDDDDDGDDM